MSDAGETVDTKATASPHPAFVRGDSLDHFIVIDRLGEGGMGVVWAAYDPDLNRKVAVKLLPLDAHRGEDRATSRMFREAQAMAKLAHPNVATVYEVGVVDDQVFIAMELIDGMTVEEWLGAERRGTDEVLQVFAAAGEGLAAAHAAGLVHRDFKPSNVMIGRDGRVVVLDFGVAGAAPGGADDSDDLADIRRDTTSALNAVLTRAGVVVGTPAYMSPEQYLGQAVDERSDQFSFCVSLYEALFQSRPFGGETIAELSEQIVQGRLESAPGDRDVPAGVRRLLERGLQRSRSARYPSMRDLLDELEPSPHVAPMRMAMVVGVVALAALIGVVVVMQRSRRDSRCAVAESHLAGVWDPPRKAAVHDGFISTNRSYGAATFEAVERVLDAYAAAWTDMRTEACKATTVRGEQSQSLLDLRMQCLDRRLSAFSALSAVFADAPSGQVVDGALEAATSLDTLDACADRDALTALLPPPDDEEVREEVALIRLVIDEATAVDQAGDPNRALAIIEPVIARAEATGYAPVRAEAQFALGSINDHRDDSDAAEPALRSAALHAAVARQDSIAARAWISLLGVMSGAARYDEALGLIRVAEAMLERAQGDANLRTRYYDVVGLVYSRSGDYKTAKTWHDRALDLAEREVGIRTLTYTVVLNNAALIRWRLGELDDARSMFQRELELERELLQPNHPSMASTLNNLGLVVAEQGDQDAALRYYADAIEIITGVFGPDHLRLADPYENTAIIHAERNELEQARAHHQRALDLRIAALGREHPDVARSLEGLGSVLWYEGKLDQATPYFQDALDIRTKTLPPDHPFIAQTINNLAGLLAMQGRCTESLPLFRRALEMREAKLGIDHPGVASSLTDIGQCLSDLGRHQEAVAPLERALAIRRAKGVKPTEIADTEMMLAMALWPVGKKQRARELASDARAVYRGASKPEVTYLGELETWMRKQGLL